MSHILKLCSEYCINMAKILPKYCPSLSSAIVVNVWGMLVLCYNVGPVVCREISQSDIQ